MWNTERPAALTYFFFRQKYLPLLELDFLLAHYCHVLGTTLDSASIFHNSVSRNLPEACQPLAADANDTPPYMM